MSTAATPVRRNTADIVVTVALLVGHALLVLFTLVAVTGMWANTDICGHSGSPRPCHGPPSWLGPAALSVMGGSGLLFLLDLVLAIARLVNRRLAFVVPLVCCIVQVIVVVGTFIVGNRVDPF
jgi:hypothetical protein